MPFEFISKEERPSRKFDVEYKVISLSSELPLLGISFWKDVYFEVVLQCHTRFLITFEESVNIASKSGNAYFEKIEFSKSKKSKSLPFYSDRIENETFVDDEKRERKSYYLDQANILIELQSEIVYFETAYMEEADINFYLSVPQSILHNRIQALYAFLFSQDNQQDGFSADNEGGNYCICKHSPNSNLPICERRRIDEDCHANRICSTLYMEYYATPSASSSIDEMTNYRNSNAFKNSSELFDQYLKKAEKNGFIKDKSDLTRRANISKTTFDSIRDPNKNVTRNNLISLCLTLRLSELEFNEMMKTKGFCLSPEYILSDAVVCYFVVNNYDMIADRENVVFVVNNELVALTGKTLNPRATSY